MRYLEESFSTFAVGSDQYRSNWEQTFGKKAAPAEESTAGVAEESTALEVPSSSPALQVDSVTLRDPQNVERLIYAARKFFASGSSASTTQALYEALRRLD